MTGGMWLFCLLPALAGPEDVVRTAELGTRGLRGLDWHDGGLWSLDRAGDGTIRSPDRSWALPPEVDAPRGLDVRDGAAWFLDWREREGTSRLWRLDLGTGAATWQPLGTVLGPAEPLALAFDGDDLWVDAPTGTPYQTRLEERCPRPSRPPCSG